MDFFNDIRNEIRLERLRLFIVKHSTYIVLGSASILMLFLGYLFLQHRENNLLKSTAEQYVNAVYGAFHRKEKLNIIAEHKRTSFSSIAQLKLAGIAMAQGDLSTAVHYYKIISSNKSLSEQYIDFANLMLIKSEICLKIYQNTESIALLKKYIIRSKHFKELASLYIAVIFLDEGNTREAEKYLDYILERGQDHRVSSGITYLVKILKHSLPVAI